MIRLTNPTQHYAWGSMTAIPDLLGLPATSEPVAESWMGAHPSAPSLVTTTDGEIGLDALIADEVRELAEACAARLADGSPSPHEDGIVVLLARAYPGDPGVVISLLLNSVTLLPGEAMFVPAGGVHAYLRGMGVEIMASSDNVLRAGLTSKRVDVDELLRTVDYVPAPPIRIAPEVFRGATKVFYAPVDDFELSVTTVDDDLVHRLPGCGTLVQADVACHHATKKERHV